MKIGEFSQLTGIPVKTLRYYSDIGLIDPEFDIDSKYRRYGVKQLTQLNKVISLKVSGFTLNEILAMLKVELSTDAMLKTLKSKLDMATKEKRMVDVKIKNLQRRIEKLQTRKEISEKMKKLIVPPFNNTLIGMVKAVSDYYGYDYSDAMLFGGTGQAFLINIHNELCPSGPYVWNHAPFIAMLKNLGIEMTDYGMFTDQNTPNEIHEIEEKIKGLIDENIPCGLVNMENQIILGYDDNRFTLSQPWGDDFPVGKLSFGTWDEFGEDKFACFYSFSKSAQVPKKQLFLDSLEYAIDLNDNYNRHSNKPYVTGLKAYDVFIQAIKDGYGSSHGNLWNSTVWSECRKMASDYFLELKNISEGTDTLCTELSKDYELIAEGILKAADKSVPIGPKVELLTEVKQIEQKALEKIKELILVLK